MAQHPATTTADGRYHYTNVMRLGRTLDIWVQLMRKHNSNVHGWYYRPLERGGYGYDALCCSIMNVFDAIQMSTNEWALARAVHAGWTENYVYWRDNMVPPRSPYRAPSYPLGDSRRDQCAASIFDELPKDEQEKDLIIARGLKAEIELIKELL